MARGTFGGTSVDWLLKPFRMGQSTLVALRDGTTILTFWSAKTGGTQYTDLLDETATAANQITITGYQLPPFQGPDGILAMWADKGDGSPRELVEAQDLAAAAAAVATAVAARDDAVAAAANTVKVTAQSFTSGQQAQARANVGSVGRGELVYRVDDETGYVNDGTTDNATAIL